MPRKARNGAIYPIKCAVKKKLKNGTVKTYVEYRAKVDGKWVAARTYDACSEKIKEALNESRQWGVISDRSVRLGDYAEEWFEGHKILLDPGSRSSYRRLIDNHLSKCGRLRISDITPTVARRIVNSMRLKNGKNASLHSKRNFHSMLNTIFKSAVADRIIPTNPMESVAAPTGKDTDLAVRSHESFTDEQVDAMLGESAKDTRTGVIQWWRLMTGMRQGEILGATWDQLTLEPVRTNAGTFWRGYYVVHWKLESVNSLHGCGEPDRNGVYPCGFRMPYKCPMREWDTPIGFDMVHLTGALCLTPPKSQRDRIVPIPIPLGTALVRYRELVQDEPNPYNLIFHQPNGRPINRLADLRSFRDLMRRSGIPDYEKRIGHECRNTAVSRLFREGVDPGKIQRIIGHSSLAMSEYYRRVPKEELLVDMERLYPETGLNQIEWGEQTVIRSSIIAINHDGRYLLYHDTNWDCDFFPNHATDLDMTENWRQLSAHLSDAYAIPWHDFALVRIGRETHEKHSVEHDEQRVYEYTLYKANIHRMPEAWKADRFHVDSKDCTWLTVDQMLADPRMREINSDVIGMVKTRL